MRTPVVLTLDTSAAACSVSLLVVEEPGGARVLARGTSPASESQTRMLWPLVEERLVEADVSVGDIGALVVGTGPGTFTGVRIGVAAARAAALALGVPVFGVSSLAAVAAAALDEAAAAGSEPPRVVVPVVDARRGQVFACVYSRYEEGERSGAETPGVQGGPAGGGPEPEPSWRRVGSIFAAAPEDLEDAVRALVGPAGPADVVVAGRADLVPAGEWGAVARPVDAAFLVAGQQRLASPDGGEGGSLLARLAALTAPGAGAGERSARPGDPGTPEAVRPVYVRAPDADLHITKMRDPWE